MIVGSAGSGKSTAARLIGAALSLPVFHMDRDVYWLPGWQERPDPERREIVARLAGEPRWVFEGSYSSTYGVRLARADLLIWLDTPLPLRLFRVVRRAILGWGRTRSDLAEGCPEDPKMLPEFVRFILRTHRRSRSKARVLFDEAGCPNHRFTTARQVNRFVAGLRADAS